MAHKTFISYKYSESQELRDRIIQAMGSDAAYYTGETSESPRQDFDAAVLVHPAMGLGPRCTDLKRKIRYPTLARLAIEERLRRENLAEEQRILYVAMTRPKEKLILVDSLYFAEKRLQRLASLAACPAAPVVNTVSQPWVWA